jgi:hypothetical protein
VTLPAIVAFVPAPRRMLTAEWLRDNGLELEAPQ